MGKFTMDDVRRIMGFKHNIRNMSVVAHVDHGKSTLTDSLVAAAGITAQEVAGDVRVMDTRPDEIDRGITIKSTGISLYYKMPDEALKGYEGERQGNEYLVNLIDSPGHADFSSEVTAALRVTDGALVVVDCIEGVSMQTETILRQALGESVRPILSINKLDKCFLKHQLDGEEAYSKFQKVIENVNVILATYEDPGLGDVHVYPEKGTLAFSAGLHGWAFTLSTFAKMHAGKFGVDESKMTARLWGENFFDPGTRKWTKKNTGSPTCKRGFVLFCYEPLKQIIDVCINNQKDKLWEMLAKLDVTMRSEEKDLTGKALVKRVMQTWIPASNALLEMMIRHLPSPAMAQRYRVDNLYEGPHEDQYAQATRACNPDGPLMLYVSKIIPASAPEKGRLFAFGRVFSGKVATGMKIRIMSPEHRHGGQGDVTKVHRTVIWMGKKFEAVREVPCGNTVAILLDDKIAKSSATVINSLGVDAHPFRAMLFFVSPAVRAAVSCSDSRKLAEELRLLNKTDPMLHYEVESSSRKFTVSCAGELQLDVCLRDLQDRIDGGAEIALSDPVLPFRESVSGDSYSDVKKSANKSNPIWIETRPLDARLVEAIEIEGERFSKINDYLMMDLVEGFGLDIDVAKKLVC